ncbi:hypothetical protein CU098_007566, partial [Rhizopus stolonifer]
LLLLLLTLSPQLQQIVALVLKLQPNLLKLQLLKKVTVLLKLPSFSVQLNFLPQLPKLLMAQLKLLFLLPQLIPLTMVLLPQLIPLTMVLLPQLIPLIMALLLLLTRRSLVPKPNQVNMLLPQLLTRRSLAQRRPLLLSTRKSLVLRRAKQPLLLNTRRNLAPKRLSVLPAVLQRPLPRSFTLQSH